MPFSLSSRALKHVLVASAILVSVLPQSAAGQTLNQPQSDKDTFKSFRWRGRPQKYCDTFLVTEFGYLYRINHGYFKEHHSPSVFNSEAGWMRNTGGRTSLGATAFLSFTTDAKYFGFKARYRRWIGEDVAIDVAPGIGLSRHRDNVSSQGFEGHIGVSFFDYVQLVFNTDVYRYTPVTFTPETNVPQIGDPKSHADFYGGVRVASGPGLIGIVGFPLAVLAIVIASGANT